MRSEMGRRCFPVNDARSATGSERCCRSSVRLFARRLGEPEAQRVELDEALGVALVVDHVLLEGDMGEAVERLRRLAADDPDMALIELEAHRALDMVLALVDERLQHRALGREPEAIIDEL